MKADEFKAQANAWAPTPVDTLNPDRVASLEQVWSIGFHKRGTMPPAITMKARGQLKTLIRTWPRGSAPALLAFALANWADVREDAEYRFGAFNSPAEPELGYLVRYAHVVADLFGRRGAAVAESESAHANTNMSAPPLSSPPPPPSPPRSPPSPIEAGSQSIAKPEGFLSLADVLALEGEAA